MEKPRQKGYVHRLMEKISGKHFETEAFAKYLFSTAWQLLEKLLSLGLTMFTSILVIRYLQPENYGVLGYIVSYITLFFSIPPMGSRSLLLRDMSENEMDKNKILGSGLFIYLLGTSITIVLVFFTLLFREPDWTIIGFCLLFAGSLYFQTSQIIEYFFQSDSRTKRMSLHKFLVVVSISLLKLLCIYLDLGLNSFIVLLVVEQAFYCISMILLYKRAKLSFRAWYIDRAYVKDILRQSWIIMLAGTAMNIYLKADQVVVYELLGKEQNGMYAAAVKLCESWYFFPYIIATSLMPALTNAKKKSEQFYYDRLAKLFGLMIWVGIAGSVIVSMLPNAWLELVLGAKYAASVTVLKIYFWSGIFIFIGYANDNWTVMERKYSLILYRHSLGAIVSVACNFWFIPYYGIEGAAWASVFGYSVSNVLCFVFVKSGRTAFLLQLKGLVMPITMLRKLAKK